MKKLLLKSLLVLVCLITGVSSAWAEEATLSISSGFTANGNLDDDQSNSWAITSDGSYTSSNSYIQVGTNKSAVTYLKLSTSAYIDKTITKIQVWATSKASTNVTTTIKIGGNGLGTSSAYTTQNASDGGTEFSVTNPNGYKGEILVEIARPSSATGAIYFNKLIVTYEDASDTRTAVNMTSFSASETTIVKGNTANTTVTNDQNGWTPSYTYTSSNTEVATVNEIGVITAVAKGTATISATLNIANDDASYKKGTTTSMDVNITVVNPEHTAHFSVNGSVNNGDDCVAREDDAITFPSDPADVYGKKFQGWTKTSDYSDSENAPSDLCKEANMGNADVTYYAVFADVEVGEDIPTIFYYEPFAGSAHSTGFASDNVAATQSMFYDKSATVWSHYTDTKAPSTTSYATNLDGSGMSNGIKIYKQINNTTATILEVKGIDIRNAKNLNVSLYNRRSYTNATLTVEYKIDNAANYTATGGTIVYNSTNDNWKFSDGLTISGTGSTLDLKISVKVTGSTNRTMLIDDVKVYGDLSGTTYTNYCTTVAAPTATITLNAACTDGKKVYGTYSNSSAWVVPANLTVSEIGIVDDALYVESYNEGAVVPANTGVMVSAEKWNEGTKDFTVNLSNEAGSSVLGTDNCLRPSGNGITADAMAAADADCKYYRLTMHNGETIGFWWGAADGAAFSLAANKAYLAVPNSADAPAQVWFEESQTAISLTPSLSEGECACYDLFGRKSNGKGLMIQNGKVVLVK